MLSPITLQKEYKEVSEAINKIFVDHDVTKENLDELPRIVLLEVSRLNKRLFEINQQLMEIYKQRNNLQ